jgi:hypothetical protein
MNGHSGSRRTALLPWCMKQHSGGCAFGKGGREGEGRAMEGGTRALWFHLIHAQ